MQQKNLDKKIVKIIITIVILVFCLTLITPAISKRPQFIVKNQKLSNQGSINRSGSIEIYWDNKATKRINSIDWGILNPDTTKTITIFIQNKEKEQITLSYYTSNWRPIEIAPYLTLNWDYDGQTIQFKDILQITFSLTVSENIQTNSDFNFDITILSTQ